MGLILVANPGSASRKYALFDDTLTLRGELHIETEHGHVIATIDTEETEARRIDTSITDITESAIAVESLFRTNDLLHDGEVIDRIGLRIVAPSEFFMLDHEFTDEIVDRLESIQHLAPLHISATLHELKLLRKSYPDTPVIGVSDSGFHRTKPNYAWNYAINIHDADRLNIKRFGYHGISLAGCVDTLWNSGKLPAKVVICHLGSGSSVSGIFHGRSIDTTMGFTPNEGVMMATRSGSISPDAAHALRNGLGLSYEQLDDYLNHNAGLQGFADQSDIRDLIAREANGDHMAHLALTTLVHTIHKAIGSMIVAMNGCDAIVFTGTVGERSAILRKRIVAHLEFLDFILDGEQNEQTTAPEKLTVISQAAKSRPIIVVPTNEAREIAKRCHAYTQ